MPWYRLRCWNHRRQKLVKVRPWIWKSNIFSHLYLPARIFLFTSCLNVWEREKQILPNGITIPKNPKTRVDILWIFTDFHRVLRVQIAPPHGNLSNAISPLTLKSSIKFQKIFQHPPPTAPTLLIFSLSQLLGTLKYLNILNNIIVYILCIANVIIKTQKCSYFSYFTFDISRNQRPDKCQHVVWKVILGYFSIIVTDLLFLWTKWSFYNMIRTR